MADRKRRAIKNSYDAALGLDPPAPSHRELLLHDMPHVLHPYLRCEATSGRTEICTVGHSAAHPQPSNLAMPAWDDCWARSLSSNVAGGRGGAAPSAERASAVRLPPQDAHALWTIPTRAAQDDADAPPPRVNPLGCSAAAQQLHAGFVDARAPVPRPIVDELAAEETEHAAADARWDAFAGNSMAVCDGLGGDGAGDDAAGWPPLLSAAGGGLDSIHLLRARADSSDCTARPLGVYKLPAGRRVRQVSSVAVGHDHLALARTPYWVHFVRVSASVAAERSVAGEETQDGDGGPSAGRDASGCNSGGGALSCAGVGRLGTRAVHASFNPRLAGEAAVLLESGHIVLMRLDRLRGAAAAAATCGGGGARYVYMNVCMYIYTCIYIYIYIHTYMNIYINIKQNIHI